MKIIDTHTHFPGTVLGARPCPIEKLRCRFEKEGLAQAWLLTTDGFIQNPAYHNDILAQAVKAHRDFFVPFCTVSPHDGKRTVLLELERCADQLGMRGVKFHPWLQAFSLTHPVVLPLLHKAGELKLPVLFHDGTPPYATALQIAAVAERVPKTKIILGHAGLDDLYEDAIRACCRQKNIYLCLCSLSAGYSREVIQRCPLDRLIWGSDGGFFPHGIQSAIEKIRGLGLSRQAQQQIFQDNPRRLLSSRLP